MWELLNWRMNSPILQLTNSPIALVPFAEYPSEADPHLRPVEVFAQADRFREVRHDVVAGVHAQRERTRHMNVEAPTQERADRRAQLLPRRDGLAHERARAGADHRPETDREERLQRLIAKVAAQRIPAHAKRHRGAADHPGANAVGPDR